MASSPSSGGAGSSTFTGGIGADTLIGGAGMDIMRYTASAQSTGANYDTITGFDASVDRFAIWTGVTAVDTPITQGAIGKTTFDSDLTIAMVGLQGHHAGLIAGNAGTLGGVTFVVVDVNGTTGYQSGADLVIRIDSLTNPTTFGLGNFV